MHVVVFSGAGISAESGIRTFRDADGLWEGYSVEDVATPEAWQRNPRLVLEFYNQRRMNVVQAQPNAAHKALAELENWCRVTVITQNVDDLHERAGSSKVIHLHGELMYARSSGNPSYRIRLNEGQMSADMKCPEGHALRPDVVWFGEAVPMMDEAIRITCTADAFIIVGTSLEVYPAAGLLDFTPADCGLWLVDPNRHQGLSSRGIRCISKTATEGIPLAISEIKMTYGPGGQSNE